MPLSGCSKTTDFKLHQAKLFFQRLIIYYDQVYLHYSIVHRPLWLRCPYALPPQMQPALMLQMHLQGLVKQPRHRSSTASPLGIILRPTTAPKLRAVAHCIMMRSPLRTRSGRWAARSRSPIYVMAILRSSRSPIEVLTSKGASSMSPLGSAKRLGFYEDGLTRTKIELLSRGNWKYQH